jgi:hypothetical protein
MKRSLTVLAVIGASLLLIAASPAVAADSPIGTWVKKGEGAKPAITLTIDEWGPGKAKLTWRLTEPQMVLTLVSALDGSFAPLLVDGKPSGQTMSIKLIDKRHTVGTMKMNGKAYGTSKSTISEDFKTMTVETDVSDAVSGNPVGKTTEIWIRK